MVRKTTSPAIAAPCRHCKRPRKRLRKGLCWACYGDPAINGQYEPLSRRGYRPGKTQETYGPRNLPKPVPFAPGTIRKKLELSRRIANGQTLWHPDDGLRTLPEGIKNWSIADKIRFLRRRKGMTRLELAHKSKVRAKSIKAYEEGYCEPSFLHLARLASVFEVSADVLFEDEGELE